MPENLREEREGQLVVEGAREHNLKDVTVEIPRYALSVVTGLSGSGKSSLAFDTIFAEGNRRYLETFSPYARGFLGTMERPDVDKITGLSPVISIEQKTTNKNPRSTVGTSTEIYDLLRLLYARTATAYSPLTGKALRHHSDEEIEAAALASYMGKKILLLAPIVRDRKGHYRELLESMRRKGFTQVRADGKWLTLTPGLALARYQSHRVEVVIDKLKLREDEETLKRFRESLQMALKTGDGVAMILEHEGDESSMYSRKMMDEVSGLSYEDPAPHTFSFNSPQGSCPKCKGIGSIPTPDLDKVIPDRKKSIREGGIVPIGSYRPNMLFRQVECIVKHHGMTLDTPLKEASSELMDDLMNGVDYPLRYREKEGTRARRLPEFDGIVNYLNRLLEDEDVSAKAQKWAAQFNSFTTCPLCHGKRLNDTALSFRIDQKDIGEVSSWALPQIYEWVLKVPDLIEPKKRVVALEIVKEISTRLKFLLDMGLGYLSLDRTTGSLSGGEMQRIRLATQLGSQLVNVLYILDEPSIGLHQRDNQRLIDSLQNLRDQGNSLIVVEHDRDMMLAADYIVDLGPRAGRNGGHVIFAGNPKELLKVDTLTAQYLRREEDMDMPVSRREGNGKVLQLTGARGNNLKGETLELPLGKLICITGVSGSGKSTYINETLYPALAKHFYRALKDPLPYDELIGLEHVDKVVQVDQAPIGRIPRSNPATYTGVFTDIRNLFVEMPESKIRGYKPGRFSFNVQGGRCEACKGNGYKKIEMNFLPDVYVPCETCKGMRYNRETLEVRYKGKSIADVLDMTINMAVEFFEHNPNILRKIQTLQDVGLGYIKLGQPSPTLSGGEAQRIKLATELMKRDSGKTLYFLDEPTTGLHFEDIRVLLRILNRLVDRGNTVVVIEHNLDVIKVADHIIDIGPEGGAEGGHIVFAGTPEEMAQQDKGYTAKYLRDELKETRGPSEQKVASETQAPAEQKESVAKRAKRGERKVK